MNIALLPTLTPSTLAERHSYWVAVQRRARRETLWNAGMLDRRGRCIPSGSVIPLPAPQPVLCLPRYSQCWKKEAKQAMRERAKERDKRGLIRFIPSGRPIRLYSSLAPTQLSLFEM